MQKTLIKLASELGLQLLPVTFKHAASGQKLRRKGYDFVNNKGYILCTIEPKSDLSIYKWFAIFKKLEVITSLESIAKGGFMTVFGGSSGHCKNVFEIRKELLSYLSGMPVNEYITSFKRSDFKISE